ncbi:MAG TPA: FUSC family protein [Candidatus Methylacidiphilales bacterium]|jgi:uncharacterized membrane protein YccC|nr:FUSC family protein [Candidatus Methylacidiphilales bacterium]
MTAVSGRFWQESRLVALAGPFFFGVRGWFACMLALYIAYALQLDQPYWAGMTVWMVMQPSPGMTISKSIYRVAGSIIGAIMGVVLLALFSQKPELFLLALAFWMGATTILSNIVTNFRSYGAVLAGYTAAIVALGTYDHPERVFDVAMARGAATVIGIICATLVMIVTARHQAGAGLLDHLFRAVNGTARRAAFPLEGTNAGRVALGRPLVADLIKLDSEIEFASAEEPAMRLHAGVARSLVAHLFAVILNKRTLEGHLHRTGPVQDGVTSAFYAQAMTLFAELPALVDARRMAEAAGRLEVFYRRLLELAPDDLPGDLSGRISSRLVLDELAEMTRHLERAMTDLAEIECGGEAHEPALALNFHRDHLAATINGLRTFLSVIVAGTFWIASAWPSGAFMLIQFSVGCGLFSTAPHPGKVALTFFKGVVAGVVAAYICTYHFVANCTDFVPFALAHALFLIPAAMLQLHPRYGLIGLSYCVFFIVSEQPLNPMNYDPVNFFNSALATLVGALLSALAFSQFLPANPRLARRYLVLRMRQQLRSIAASEPIPPYWAWQTRNFDRVNRLADPANPSGDQTDEWFEGGLGALLLGQQVLRLRHLLREGALSAPAQALAKSAVEAFRKILAQPAASIATLHAVHAALLQTSPAEVPGARRDWCRLQGIVGEMDAFLVEHPAFLVR